MHDDSPHTEMVKIRFQDQGQGQNSINIMIKLANNTIFQVQLLHSSTYYTLN